MTSRLIKLLTPELANQIAAGEVVERPASVVKELLENSLDSGAKTITIEIENGGSSLIKIRDDGIGIYQEDLPLALARHATSKIASLDDLSQILSFGFRGEALASISSVSRLTLTSKPSDQANAWQAYAAGRDMQVEINPASHPNGTTVEVANLFFNTPARRKFLRSDKTEFQHIEETVKRIALAKSAITITLFHNGKRVAHYQGATSNDVADQQKRIAAIFGDKFIENSIFIDWQHSNLHLRGWIGKMSVARSTNDLNYSYVNGRMMKDKTINHAVRQAFGDYLPKNNYPAFVLFLDLPPDDVDVNVHPAKHEVRFHQNRLVHDFIYQGVFDALHSEFNSLDQDCLALKDTNDASLMPTNKAAAGLNSFAKQDEVQKSIKTEKQAVKNHQENTIPDMVYKPQYYQKPTPSQSSQKAYAELIKPYDDLQNIIENKPLEQTKIKHIRQDIYTHSHSSYLKPLALVQQKALLLEDSEGFYLLPLRVLSEYKFKADLKNFENDVLLIPLALKIDEKQYQHWQALKPQLEMQGFEIVAKKIGSLTKLVVNKVPRALRSQNLQKLLVELLTLEEVNLMQFLVKNISLDNAKTLSSAISDLSCIELDQRLMSELKAEFIEVDFNHFFKD